MQPVLLGYAAGVVLGLWKVDAPLGKRIGLALLWPVGLLAAAVTLPLLVASALVLFPAVGVPVAAAAAVAWWILA